MKCMPLRRRYLVFISNIKTDDASIISSLKAYIEPNRQTRIIYNKWPFVILRIDHISLGLLNNKLGRQMIIFCGMAELSSITTTGSIKKAREKIKTLQEKLRTGDEEAVPVKSE